MAKEEVEETNGFHSAAFPVAGEGVEWGGWSQGWLGCFLFLYFRLPPSLPLLLTQSGRGLRAPNLKASFFPLYESVVSEAWPRFGATHTAGRSCLLGV